MLAAISARNGTFKKSDASAAIGKASKCLKWAAILMPLGFLGGGVWAMGADPGFVIVLVPLGGLLMFAGVLFAARAASSK